MKCGMTLKAMFYTGPGVITNGSDCIETECAWWDAGLEICSVLAQQEAISLIAGTLLSIERAMPKEGQFADWGRK